MKKFILKSILFLIPFLAILGIELFILPIDFFTFRVWESLVVRKFKNILPGPFYPNMEINKIEEGDLASYTRLAVKKRVKWITDRYGYRKRNTAPQKHQIVIVGESNIVGSSLTQDDILSEVLEDQLKVSVYPYAPVGLNSFLKDGRFIENPPDIVIFAKVERELFDLPLLKQQKGKKWSSKLKQKIQENRMIQTIAMQLDRIFKMSMLRYLRASLKRSISGSHKIDPASIPVGYIPNFFLQGAIANRDVSKENFNKTVHIIKTYHDAVKNKGIRFIFSPIPNKENIHHEELRTERPVFLEQLIFELKHQGIEVIDTQEAFREVFRKDHIPLYQPDDSHWNANGVKLTAYLIKDWLERKE